VRVAGRRAAGGVWAAGVMDADGAGEDSVEADRVDDVVNDAVDDVFEEVFEEVDLEECFGL
jgi:hypothetical protein